MKQLETTFTGRGQVKGFIFTQINKSKMELFGVFDSPSRKNKK